MCIDLSPTGEDPLQRASTSPPAGEEALQGVRRLPRSRKGAFLEAIDLSCAEMPREKRAPALRRRVKRFQVEILRRWLQRHPERVHSTILGICSERSSTTSVDISWSCR